MNGQSHFPKSVLHPTIAIADLCGIITLPQMELPTDLEGEKNNKTIDTLKTFATNTQTFFGGKKISLFRRIECISDPLT